MPQDKQDDKAHNPEATVAATPHQGLNDTHTANNPNGLFATGKLGFSVGAKGGIKATVVDANDVDAAVSVTAEGTINKPSKPCNIL